MKGKYKEFRYEIDKIGWTILHKHFKLCHVFDMTYPFEYDPKTKKRLKGFDIKNKEHVNYVRKHIYKECEEQLKNPWWRGLNKPKKKEPKQTTKIKTHFPLVQVKWLDAQTGFAALMPISEFKNDFKPFYNYSFGYLLEDNKDHIILGFLLMDSEVIDEETGVKHWQLIPKGMVRKITKLKEDEFK